MKRLNIFFILLMVSMCLVGFKHDTFQQNKEVKDSVCAYTDITSPVISFKNEEGIILAEGTELVLRDFVEVSDEISNVNVTSFGKLDVDEPGTYIITILAIDSCQNMATELSEVKVVTTEEYAEIEAQKQISISPYFENGTYFDNEKLSVSHNFTNSPTFEDALQSAIDNYDIFGEMGEELMVPFVLMALAFFCGPLVIIIIVAIVNIVKYSKNKKILKRYELTYGSISQYKASPQNYGGYGYNQPVNQPVNQPYQPPVNPAYQQNPINQNVQQTPSYVTNAVENLNEQVNQTQQPVQTPETQVIENNEGVGE